MKKNLKRKPGRRGLLARLGCSCAGSCSGGDGDRSADTEVIDMTREPTGVLQIRDFTGLSSNLVPMLPDEVEFRRVENFHCRNLTIVEQSPIAVRKFEDMTKELKTVKEPTAIVLPHLLPFDQMSDCPSFGSQAQTDDENCMSDCDFNSSWGHEGTPMSLDAKFYTLAEQICQIEQSRLSEKTRYAGVSDQLESESDADPFEEGINSPSSKINVGDADGSMRRSNNAPSTNKAIGHANPNEDGRQGDASRFVQAGRHGSSLWKICAALDAKGARSQHVKCDANGAEGATRANSADEDPNPSQHRLHHVSEYCTEPSMTYVDPFDENEEDTFWPFALGASVWKFMIGQDPRAAPANTIDYNLEGSIASLYSKEELRELCLTFKSLPRSDAVSIVESTLSLINT